MQTYLLVGLVTFDVLLLTGLYFYLRSHAPLKRRVLFPVAAGLVGFVIQALLFFSGPMLFVQLGTIAGIFGVYFVVSAIPRKEES